jgi:PKD repeat protein
MFTHISRVTSKPTLQIFLLLVWSWLPLTVSAEITMGELTITYAECGVVTINGGAWEDGYPITDIDWEWGDDFVFTRQFPASHQYASNGTHDVVLIVHGPSGATRTEQLSVQVNNAGEPGCEVVRTHLDLGNPNYASCGEVSINGSVWSELGEVTRITWDWNDETVTNSFFPAVHKYNANGSYMISVTAHTDTGDSRTESVAVVIDNAEVEGCDIDFVIHPWQVYLRDGVTEKQLRIEARDGEGRPVDPQTLNFEYEVDSDEIGDLQVTATGMVSATGYGRGRIRVVLQPHGRAVEIEVHAGHLRTAPMFQYLSVNGQTSGSVWPVIANADGTPFDLEGHEVGFECSGCEPGQPLQIDAEGNLLVVDDFEQGDPAPLSVHVLVDGEWAEYAAVIHVGEVDLGVTLMEYVTHDTIISSPTGAGGYDFDAAITDYLMPKLYDLGYKWQVYLMSGSWWDGPRQALINYTSLDRFDGTFPGCAGNGNPIRMGTNIEEPWASCFFTDIGGMKMVPRWGIAFHEMGHNMTWSSGLFGKFAAAGDGFNYSEGLATAAGMFTCEAILRAGEDVGVTAAIAESFAISGLCWQHSLAGTFLPKYVTAGADYSTMTPDLVDDILWYLVKEFDYGLIYRLFGMFTPRSQPGYPFEIVTTEQQATMFAIGCSVAAGTDLKSRFRNEWGFPIDDQTWDEMYPVIEQMIKARYPASNAGADRRIEVGSPVLLDDAFVFDREQDELTLEWDVVSKPPGSAVEFGNSSLLKPMFAADRMGEYILSLRVSDQWVQGEPDKVTITVFDPYVIFSSGFER